MVRKDSKAGFSKARYSNWWPAAEVVKQHARRILDTPECGGKDICQRSTFRKTRWVTEMDAFLRRRLKLPGATEEGKPVDVIEGEGEAMLNLFQ